VAGYPVDVTNNPLVIARQPNMFSLNNIAQIDLTGQVNSEQIPAQRPVQISGTGGQLDFVMGTMLSLDRKGVSILALYSTYKEQSRIRVLLEEGACVTVPRTLPQYVVTEYGMVNLRGRAIYERADALIAIAHPRFREALRREAHDRGLLPYRATVGAKRNPAIVILRD
jgi:acyl-CoA hydrolase